MAPIKIKRGGGKMSIGKKIQKLRKGNGLSQEQLAEKFGLSRQSISKWESEQSVPDISNIVQLSELFGVSTDYLVKDQDEDSLLLNSEKKPVHTFIKKRMIILAAVLVISLLSNLILRADLRNSQNNARAVLDMNQTAFFETLEEYSDVLGYIAEYEGDGDDLYEEVRRLQIHVNELKNYAAVSVSLSESSLSAYLLDMANSSRWVLREYFLDENEKDLKIVFDTIDTDKITQVVEVLDAIVELEKNERSEMSSTGKEYSDEEMAEVFDPKLTELVQLTLLSES